MQLVIVELQIACTCYGPGLYNKQKRTTTALRGLLDQADRTQETYRCASRRSVDGEVLEDHCLLNLGRCIVLFG